MLKYEAKQIENTLYQDSLSFTGRLKTIAKTMLYQSDSLFGFMGIVAVAKVWRYAFYTAAWYQLKVLEHPNFSSFYQKVSVKWLIELWNEISEQINNWNQFK